MTRAARLALRLMDWYERHRRDLPWRRTDDPYAIWVSEVMLQQTQVATVIPFWRRWMEELPTMEALAEADPSRILKLWEGLGYYRRARNLQLAAREIMARWGGRFPANAADAQLLPGVGRYTAGAVCSIAFNQPAPILDGNVARVLSRILALEGDPDSTATKRTLWEEAETLVRAAADTSRPRACSHLNQALMELGAMVCAPRAPRCGDCPVARECRAFSLGAPERFPAKRTRPPLTPRHYLVFVAVADGLACVRQRPEGSVNGGLWEFPNIEAEGPDADPAPHAAGQFGARAAGAFAPWMVVRHGITRYRIQQRVYLGRFESARGLRKGAGQWLGMEEIAALPFSSAHARVARALKEVWK